MNGDETLERDDQAGTVEEERRVTGVIALRPR